MQKQIKSHSWRISIIDYQTASKQKLPKQAYDYFSAGADDQITLKHNRKAFKRIKLYPRVLKDMTNVSMKTKILGFQMSIPFGVAPIAMQKLIHPQGEILAAKEAYQQKTAYGLSMLSTCQPKQIVTVNPSGLKIHQLYLLNNAQYTKQFIKMIASNGFHAVALTVDTQMFGKRRVDMVNKFLPKVTLEVFKQLGVQIEFDSPKKPENSFIKSINNRITWQDVRNLKNILNQFKLKLILKGISEEKDVILAHQVGADAIWVSNHGGRQLDTSPSTVQVLPFIKNQIKRVGSKMQLYVDGGILKGSDIFKCLALGADFVFVGRGFLYSLIDGADGIRKAFNILKSQLQTTMKLTGTNSISQITSDYVIFQQPYTRL